MQSMLSGLPCCLNCQDFLPPWALKEGWDFDTHGDQANGISQIIECAHISVCARCRDLSAQEAHPGAAAGHASC